MSSVLYFNQTDIKAISVMNNVSSITDMQANTFSYMKADLLYVNRIVDPEGTGSNQEDNAYNAQIAIAPLVTNSANYNNPLFNDCGAVGLINNSQGVSLDFSKVELPVNGSDAYEYFPYNYVGSNLNYNLNKSVYDKVKKEKILLASKGINFSQIKYIPVVTVTDIDFDKPKSIELNTNLLSSVTEHVVKLFWWDYIKFLNKTYTNIKINGKVFDIKKWRYIISVELVPAYALTETEKYIIPSNIKTPDTYIYFGNIDYTGLDYYLVNSDTISNGSVSANTTSCYTYKNSQNKLKFTTALDTTISDVQISEMFEDKGRKKAQIVKGKYQGNTGERTLINAKLGTNSNNVLVFGCPDSYQPLPLYEEYNSPYPVDPTSDLTTAPTVMAMPFIPAYNLKEMNEHYKQNTNNKSILFSGAEFENFYCNGTTVVNVTNRPSLGIPEYNYFSVPFLEYRNDSDTKTGEERIDLLCYSLKMADETGTAIEESIEYLKQCCLKTQLHVCFEVGGMIDEKNGQIWTPATDPHIGSEIMDKNGNIHKGTDDDFNNYLDVPEYQPALPPDPDKYSDETSLTRPSITGASVFNNMYAMTANAVNLLAEGLWNLDSTEIGTKLALMGANPIDSIVSLRLYPFAITGGSQTTVKVGTIDFGIQGILVNDSQMNILDLGTVFLDYINPEKMSYLDFEPYTMLELYIPYCGKIPLSASQFINHNVNVKLCVDYQTGACVGIVFRDNIAVHYAQGQIGVDIQITGRNASEQQIAVAQHLMSGLGNVMSGSLNVVGSTKNLMSTGTQSIKMFDDNYNTYNLGGSMNMQGLGMSQFTSGTGQLAKGIFDIKTSPQYKTYVERVGSATPSCSLYEPKYCYIIVQRCLAMETNSDYESLIGHACSKTDTIEKFHGFTQLGSVKLDNVPCTLEEKNMLTELFEQGVYLP